MDPDLRQKAEEKFQNKRGFNVITTIFVCISILLYIISLNIGDLPEAIFWIRFPILVLGLVLLIIYVSLFGFTLDPNREAEWEEEEILREMAILSLKEKQKTLDSPQEIEELQLRDLEELKEKQKDLS